MQKEANDGLHTDVENLQVQKNELQNSILNLECRSVKNNLVFTGIGGRGGGETR